MKKVMYFLTAMLALVYLLLAAYIFLLPTIPAMSVDFLIEVWDYVKIYGPLVIAGLLCLTNFCSKSIKIVFLIIAIAAIVVIALGYANVLPVA